MSFMLISGKIFFCNECNKTIRVEYKGGPQITQIGDLNIMNQLELSEQMKKLKQPNPHPEEQGYYLYEVGYCEKCYKKRVDSDEKDKIQEFFKIIETLTKIRSKTITAIFKLLPEMIESAASKMTPDDMGAAIGSPFDPYLGDRHALPAKRQRMIRAFIQDNSRSIESYLSKKVLEESSIAECIAKWEQSIEAKRNRFNLLMDQISSVYIMKKTNAVENLNDFIISDNSVRKPVFWSPNEKFYFPSELNTDGVTDLFDVTSEISRHDDISKYANSIIERLTKV